MCFSTGQWPQKHTSRLCKDYLTKKEWCIRWPDFHYHPTSTQLRWFGMSWTAEWRKSSQQVLSMCGNSFKTVGKVFLTKLVERMPRECQECGKLSSRQRVATLKNLKYILIYMCYFMVLMSSLLFYNVENSKNKENPFWLLTGTVCLTLLWSFISPDHKN